MWTWLFRPQCAACTAPAAAPFCAACSESLVPATGDIAPWQFGGALASAIRRLKFARATHVARTLAPLWSPLLAAAVAEHEGIVVPVPLHWRRRWKRGYDQTWLLATHACRDARIGKPVIALRRTRHSPAQSTLPASQRAANVDGAFEIIVGVRGKSIVLVDDVVTTGATLAAATRALYAGGAVHVAHVAVATSVRG
jgi:ComF family protein